MPRTANNFLLVWIYLHIVLTFIVKGFLETKQTIYDFLQTALKIMVMLFCVTVYSSWHLWVYSNYTVQIHWRKPEVNLEGENLQLHPPIELFVLRRNIIFDLIFIRTNGIQDPALVPLILVLWRPQPWDASIRWRQKIWGLISHFFSIYTPRFFYFIFIVHS